MRPLTPRSRVVRALQRIVLRTADTPLARLWTLIYQAIARAGAAYLTRGEPEAAAYIRAGGLGAPDFLPGLSDIDLAIVVPEDRHGPGIAGGRVRRRWQRLRRLQPLSSMLDMPLVYEDAELDDQNDLFALTYGLERSGRTPGDKGAYFGLGVSPDRMRALHMPGLYGATAGWRLFKGPERRREEPARDPQARRLAAWIELTFWWRHAFRVCIDPDGPRGIDLSVKCVAEAARIWIWLAVGERAAARSDALARGVELLPEEAEGLRGALELGRSLSGIPESRLGELLPAFVRISGRIADLITEEVDAAGATEVKLLGAEHPELLLAGGDWPEPLRLGGAVEPRLVPLADWRSLVCPLPPDEALVLLGADPTDPSVLGAAASQETGPYPAFRTASLLILAGHSWLRTRMRALQCSLSDPVSFALLEGDGVARFPNVRGWSAQDTGRRAVAEHRAWLSAGSELLEGWPPEPAGNTLGMLFSAARAALFHESVEDGSPELPLTVTQTARTLGTQSTATESVAEDALGSYRELATDGRQPSQSTVAGMREVVVGLPAYSQLTRGPAPDR